MRDCAVLALESGGVMASAALIDTGGRLHYVSAESGQSHSSQLLPMAKRLLETAGLSWGDLKGMVAGVGPGSFTGLRIACSLVQGLALGAQKPVLPVSSFEAWAYAWWLKWGEGKNRCLNISFDARLGERFAAAISVDAQADSIALCWKIAPQVVSQGEWIGTPAAIQLDDPDAQMLGLEPLPLAAWMARLACVWWSVMKRAA